jgi:hypothetical protein
VGRWGPNKTSGLVVTGAGDGCGVLESVRFALGLVDGYADEISQKFRGCSMQLMAPNEDVVVQFLGCAAPIDHGLYMAAACVALLSLLLERRPREGTAVLGVFDQPGRLRTCTLKKVLSGEDVRECQRQEIRHLLLSNRMTLDASAVAALQEPGTVKVVQCEHLRDVASHCFASLV